MKQGNNLRLRGFSSSIVRWAANPHVWQDIKRVDDKLTGRSKTWNSVSWIITLPHVLYNWWYIVRSLPTLSLSLYIYIYIYCHPQTDCFVVSQLFSVVRHVGRLKLGSKPAQLFVRLSIIPHNQQAYHVN